LRRRGAWRHLLAVFLPNRAISPAAMRVLVAAELVIALVIWFRSPFNVLPRADEILRALRSLWMNEGLGPALWTSFEVNLGALGWSTLIALGLAYLTVLPLFRPVAAAVSKG